MCLSQNNSLEEAGLARWKDVSLPTLLASLIVASEERIVLSVYYAIYKVRVRFRLEQNDVYVGRHPSPVH